MTDNLKKIFKQEPDTICKIIDNEIVIIPLGEDVGIKDLGSFYFLKNATAIHIWQLIDGKKNLGQIKESIMKRFEADPKKVELDMLNFIKQLKDIKAIIEL